VEHDAIAKAAQGISKETLILAMGGKMSEKSYLELCANNGVEPNITAIKAGAHSLQLRQTKVK
jgi:predicted HicB family RNase H-like nuclease